MLAMGMGSFYVFHGITGVKDSTFGVGDLVAPLTITPTNIVIKSDFIHLMNASSSTIQCIGGNVGIGMAPADSGKLCIKFPEHELKFYDCIHFAESTPETTSMYLMYKIGTSLYKIPCYGAD
jgi:hypothetical protein